MLHSKDYVELVQADLEKYSGLIRPVKARFFERFLIRRASVRKLHANPEDEFSMTDIGPNYAIVRNYTMSYINIKRETLSKKNAALEPLIVEKVKPRGYLILNGHHRWLAAYTAHKKTLPIQIVNFIHESEILQSLRNTNNRVCVSFDLDEVIRVPGDAKNVEPKPKNVRSLLYRETIREGTPALIDALRRMGCDIWIYTGQYLSEGHIRALLKLYHVKVDGVVNGMKNQKAMGNVKKHFTERYDASVHVDVNGVTCVDTKSRSYATTDLTKGESQWASEAIAAIREMETIKRLLSEDNANRK